MISEFLRLCGSIFLLSLLTVAQARDYAKWVDPFIGTGGHGHTFPGATMPFGMVQLSPDTRTDNWDGSSGYHYSDDIIYGFSHTHLSGTGIPDGCDILLTPATGAKLLFGRYGERDRSGFTSRFSHADERAEPGYYSVKLLNDGIVAEMTTTARVGLHRYTFPTSIDSNIILNLKWRDKVIDSQIKVVGRNRVEGYRRSGSWAKDQIVYFVAEFSKPFKTSSIAAANERTSLVFDVEKSIKARGNPEIGSEKDLRLCWNFETKAGERILVKVAISSVSIEGARKNLAAELPGWDFDKVRADARSAWNRELSKIEVSGGTDDQTKTFYTALYHTMIQPNVFNDVDGNYRGMDGKVHSLGSGGGEKEKRSRGDLTPARQRTTPSAQSGGHPSFVRRGAGMNPKSKVQSPKSQQYTVFSLWDTFRAAHPLYTIIDQRRTADFINTFIRQYEQGGRLPVWELWGNETDCMIGYHAVSVIADAMAKGVKGFDYEKAYAAAKHSAELDRDGLAAYKKRGYISMEDENESVSKTLEYAYDDWCIAQMAHILAKRHETQFGVPGYGTGPDDLAVYRYREDGKRFASRARSFENLFDPTTGFMRPKKNGGFITPFAPNEVTFNFTEGNAWVYSFFVPHDLERLMQLQGGPDKFAAKLDELFTTKDKLAGREQPDITGLIGQYAHGNEPSHHIAYLYNYAKQPWKTQKYVRQILDEFYKPTPDGLIGNEDCGQMSAWYVMSAMGLYEVAPGNPVYDLGTPLFKEVKISLENSKSFVIRAPNVSATNIYVKSKFLNGKDIKWPWTQISHEELMKGGTLDLEMSPEPVRLPEFVSSTIFPFSVAVPLIGDGSRTFDDSMKVSMSTVTPGAKILYTTDGSVPKKDSAAYTEPITIHSTTVFKAVTNFEGDESLIAEATYVKRPNDWTVKIDGKYNRQYTGGGDEGLIDGVRGTLNFASGEWQGYQPQDFVATVDLQRETEIRRVGGGFLQNARSWIWMPTRIEVEVSTDGTNFTRVADIKTDIAVDDMEPKIRDYVQTISPVKARFVRIHAYNLGKIPSWHPGAGNDAFIFVDEILIN